MQYTQRSIFSQFRLSLTYRYSPPSYFKRSCSQITIVSKMAALFATDPCTQSNYWEITTKHVHFDWTVDWKKRTISGSATHTLVIQMESPSQVIFDTQVLDVKEVEVEGKKAKYEIREPHPVMGAALVIDLDLPPNLNTGTTLKVKIDYNTTPDCTAIGWLEKEQTAGKKFDFLFSQCQPIYARSLAPLQDTPSVKLTYSASVRSVLPALMSARRVSPPAELVHGDKEIGKDEVEYKYDQPTAIPSYIIAIASGNLVYKPFKRIEGKSWTTGVWTEPETMDAAFWEFSEDTASYVATAEEIVTPYEFGIYDILVLPPSFPYGGMENACLTFLTPTLLAGDRSLVDVVAHEASHSWFGNNVTTADSGHFWLNEGFTTYMERILEGRLHGAAARDFSYIIGRNSLTDALKQYEDRPKYQRLVIPYTFGEDPDDAYSTIPYEKGANFLLYLERILGGLDVFLPYIQDYVKTFRGKSIRTPQWQSHLFKYFEVNGGKAKLDILNSVKWDSWLHGEGLELPETIEYDTSLADRAYKLANRWDESRNEVDVGKLKFSPSDLDDFTSNQIAVFLEKLQSLSKPLPGSHIRYMNNTYTSFDDSGNAEIRSRWYELVLASEAATDFSHAASVWVIGKDKHSPGVKGRMKFCRPAFRSLNKVDTSLAKKTFEENKQFFHPIAVKLMAKDLGLS